MRAPAAVVLTLAVVLPGCVRPDEARPEDVLGTAYPVAFLAERLGGGNVTVGTVVPFGVEPHDWEPTAADLARIDAARVVVAQGAGFDPWIDDLVANLGEGAPRVVVATRGVDLHAAEEAHADDGHAEEGHADHGPLDPHTWLDPLTYKEQVGVVAKALRSVWPEHDRAVAERAEAFAAELDALHAEYAAGLADCDVRFVIASHDAYGYMAERYGFEVVAVSGLSPEAEPDPRTVARIVDLAEEHDVRVVYFEELVSPKVVEAIAREVGAETRVLSPVEGLTPDQAAAGLDYFDLMRANLDALRDGMRCR